MDDEIIRMILFVAPIILAVFVPRSIIKNMYPGDDFK